MDTQLTSLGDAEMQGVVPAELVHLCGEHPIRLHHDQRVGGLHREEEVVVVVLPADLSELNRRLYHAARRVAPIGHDSRRKGAMVSTDSHSAVEVLALLDQRCEELFDVYGVCLKLLLQPQINYRTNKSTTHHLAVVDFVFEALDTVGEVAGVHSANTIIAQLLSAGMRT